VTPEGKPSVAKRYADEQLWKRCAIRPSIRGVQAALQRFNRCGQVLIMKESQDVEGLLEPELQELHGGIGKRRTANAHTSFERDGMLGKTRRSYSLPTCVQVVL